MRKNELIDVLAIIFYNGCKVFAVALMLTYLLVGVDGVNNELMMLGE